MPVSNSVRFSRDGDQFHYLWAARRCLLLLSPQSDLKAISIEGSAVSDTERAATNTGEEVVDVAEYYGGESLKDATFVSYVQLKHSTQNSQVPWLASGIKKTLAGFAKKFVDLKRRNMLQGTAANVDFRFITNRPLSGDLRASFEKAAQGSLPDDSTEYQRLSRFTNLNGKDLADFTRVLKIEAEEAGFLQQRILLGQETSRYLPGGDVDAPTALKELVTRKATSESAANPSITRIDVLRALGTSEADLFPAPSLLNPKDSFVARAQEDDIAKRVAASQTAVLIHATAGVGKSVLASRLGAYFPTGSVTVVYDCFGNGSYRRVSSPRHRHRDALVEIANELSSQGLCDPLIPNAGADNKQYLRAFLHRLQQSVASVQDRNPQALVCILVDAADNAEMASQETGDGHSFIRDLLREPMIRGVRIVALCRPERRHLLDVPSEVTQVLLAPFNIEESTLFLRHFFPAATEADVSEFHRLTSHNPRVQAAAIGSGKDLGTIFRNLGPSPKTVDDTLEQLLENAINRLREGAIASERKQIDSIAVALSTLRPFIPIPVLAQIARVDESTVRSFAADLGSPLFVTSDAIQFRDEPTETWFRRRFRATEENLSAFIQVLRPLASHNTYVASALPALLLEAGLLTELIELALSSSELPEDDPVARRDVEVQRLLFALKASLRARRYPDSAKLALKAGQEMVGDARQRVLFQKNTDLLCRFMGADRIEAIVARRAFSETWLGSHHLYEAALFSGIEALHGDARSRLRMAYDWLRNWGRLSDEERRREPVRDEDIATIAAIEWTLRGATAAAAALRAWRPREVSFRAGAILCRQYIDHGRHSELLDLAVAGSGDPYLILAIALELRKVHQKPPKPAVRRTIKCLQKYAIKIEYSFRDLGATLLEAVCALIEAAHHYRLADRQTLASVLAHYLPQVPPHGIDHDFGRKRISLLQAYALRAALVNENLDVWDLADPELRKKRDSAGGQLNTSDLRDFEKRIGALLPWHNLKAKLCLEPGSLETLRENISFTQESSQRMAGRSYRDRSMTSNEVAELWFDILTNYDYAPDLSEGFRKWIDEQTHPLFTPTWTALARSASRTAGFEHSAHSFAKRAFDLVVHAKEDAESKAEVYVGLARSLLPYDSKEAEHYFLAAIDIVSRLGDEVLDRWSALLDLADQAGNKRFNTASEIAYRLARCAEVVESYNSKHFEWNGTVKAIAGLSAQSALAIISRWRDRRFGYFADLLTVTAQHLADRGSLDPLVLAGLTGFDAAWVFPQLLRSALTACQSVAEREKVFRRLFRYIRLSIHSESTWKSIKETIASFGVKDPGLDEQIVFASKCAAATEDTSYQQMYQSQKPVEPDWDAILANLDLTSSTDVSKGYKRFRERGHYDVDSFFKQLVERTIAGHEADLIVAVGSLVELNFYQQNAFFDRLPNTWLSRLSVRAALKSSLQSICERFCMEITRSRYYARLPSHVALRAAGVSEGELIDVVLNALSHSAETMDSHRLFSLVSLLTPHLATVEALDALRFGLGLLENVLTEQDGDGSWRNDLQPPTTTEEAAAGLIYAALADPDASIRWQAAHSVRLLCTFERRIVIDHLIRFASAGKGGPFADSGLYFYSLHAQQWLLIALARVAREIPGFLVPYKTYFLERALEGDHVLIRHFAAQALTAMLTKRCITLRRDVYKHLLLVNESPFPKKRTERHNRFDRSGAQPIEGRPSDPSFRFGYDMDRYWFEYLAECFALSAKDVEGIATSIIREEWMISDDGGWKTDERMRRNLFKDRETWHSHSTYPRSDDRTFYLSYHAMMTAAGKMLVQFPLHQDPRGDEDEFREWMKRHLPTRPDGRWLSDRRDPKPFEWPHWKTEKRDEHWRWMVNHAEFDRVLGLGDDRLNIWGHWKTGAHDGEQTVTIYSALVSSASSYALLQAAQSAAHAYDVGIPSQGDRSEIDHGIFSLKGWIADEHSDGELDSMDPWAGSVSYPAPRPASAIRQRFGLESDADGRVWKPKNSKDAFWSQMWSDFDRDEDGSATESGQRLQVSKRFLLETLREMRVSLIVKVVIERRLRRSKYSTYSKEDHVYISPYFKIYVFEKDGTYQTLRETGCPW